MATENVIKKLEHLARLCDCSLEEALEWAIDLRQHDDEKPVGTLLMKLPALSLELQRCLDENA